ncbi:unnamed protein product [Miscanthus lutarioriparius]|uniref:thioredoxin-dependent peroxiredoxin n=1 Tax=Miscanthus lutarioriparius TaxID=422564 RepID=A0A811NJT8_9POAL|nr:unnamed protein product [Miscanthus lutarioriparius]
MAAMAGYAKEFEKRGVKLLGISCDDVESHREWTKDIEAYGGGKHKVTYPILADPGRDAIRQLNMVDPDEKDAKGVSLPSRALHVVGPDKAVKLSFLYPATTGRNMEEVLRAVDSLLTAAKHGGKVAMPANWKPGECAVIVPGVSDEEARKMFPQGFETADLPSKKGYLHFTKRVTNSRRRRLARQQPIDSDPFGLRFPNTAAAIVLGLEKRRNYRSLPRRDHTATRTDFCATPLLPFRRTPRGHHFLASCFTSQRCPHCTITPHSHSGMKDSRATYNGEVAALQDDSTASA